MKESRFLIIDGNSIGFKASCAKSYYKDEMKTSDGIVVGTIYRFINMLNKIFNIVKPTHIIVCFDTPGKTFRHNIDNTYKANRIKTRIDPSIIPTIDIVNIQFTNFIIG